MKKTVLIIGLLAGSATIYGQDFSTTAKDNFSKLFPQVSDVDWYEIAQGFQAEFLVGEAFIVCSFDDNGVWANTRHTLWDDEVPQVVKSTCAKNFPSYDTNIVEKIDSPKGVTYEVSLSGNDDEVILILDAQGVIKTSKKIEYEYEEDEDY